MTDFVGAIAAMPMQAQRPVSSDLSAMSAPSRGAVLSVVVASGAKASPGLRTIDPVSALGCEAQITHLWEKAILSPQVENFGLLASTQQFQVELWNTHRNVEVDISSISIVGVGGLALSGAVPAAIGPLDSATYTATIPQNGVAAIMQVASFNVVRLDTRASWMGATLSITGLRARVWPFDPDWSDGIKEKVKYSTKILVGTSGCEQRVSLRVKPRRELSFSVFPDNLSQQRLLSSLLIGAQSNVWEVPWWQDILLYGGTIAAGSTQLALDTSNTMFSKAPMLMFWASPTSWEIQSISTYSAALLTFTATAASWSAPRVVPVFRGHFSGDSLTDSRYTSEGGRMPVAFEVDAA